MARRTIRSLIQDEGGAIAATYALALFALVALGGIAFDYARLVSVDTELQNAADQAAIAAATQLDQKSGAIARAQSAVTSYFANSGSSVVNKTLLAEGNQALTGVTFTFYTSYDSANDTFGAATTSDATARVVQVHIDARRAEFAFTPIVDALTSTDIVADAVAGLQSAICKTPPLMVCGVPGTDFPSAADVGKGVLLVPGSAGAWAPGTFGYLDFGNGANAVQDLLGSNNGADQCADGSTVTAQQGQIASAPKYLNTRFDIYENPLTPADCGANGDNCPAASTRKDLVRREMHSFNNVVQSTPPARPACDPDYVVNGNGTNATVWTQLPASALPASAATQGFPRDTCHNSGSSNSTGTCTDGNFGDGVWNITGYQAAHPNVPTNLITRYDIYKWERDNPGSGLQSLLVNGGDPIVETNCQTPGNGNGNQPTKCDYTWTNYCSYPTAIDGTYHATPKDRRVLTVAVVDCSSDVGGAHTFAVNRWMDVFLTEPSWDRDVPYTRSTQIYAEIIGVATTPTGANAFQYYGRNKAVLLR